VILSSKIPEKHFPGILGDEIAFFTFLLFYEIAFFLLFFTFFFTFFTFSFFVFLADSRKNPFSSDSLV